MPLLLAVVERAFDRHLVTERTRGRIRKRTGERDLESLLVLDSLDLVALGESGEVVFGDGTHPERRSLGRHLKHDIVAKRFVIDEIAALDYQSVIKDIDYLPLTAIEILAVIRTVLTSIRKADVTQR